MVFYVVVGPPGKQLGDFSPLVAVLLMGLEHGLLLALAPRVLVDSGVEVVVPTTWKKVYRSLHCLPVRFSMPYFELIFSLIYAQLRVPCFLTSATIALSS